MKQILWFRRDLRVSDSALLAHAKGEVFPIFIFDKHILSRLSSEDKRVTFIYDSVLALKRELQALGLDLAIFHDEPKNVFEKLKDSFDEVLCSCDFDRYAIKRDKELEKLLPMKRFYDSFLIHPNDTLKSDGTPYRVFTPFFKTLEPLHSASHIVEYAYSEKASLKEYDYGVVPSIESLGFTREKLPDFLEQSGFELLDEFEGKMKSYEKERDYFFKDATSKLSVHLRFGLISPREVFNRVKSVEGVDFFIRELFWREFYNYILYHFPKSEFENFNEKEIAWSQNKEHFQAWCEGKTGVPIIDAAMRHLNETGLMHNRLRMVVASFLTKNLFLPWQWGESYFAKKLLDYEASSNVGSWQWSASTGADSVPYFRIFNPYAQSKKFDSEGIFIKSVIKELADLEAKLLHRENGVQSSIFEEYPKVVVDIKRSREEAIRKFKQSY